MALKAIESATAVIGNVHLVYPKDEADNVIADLLKQLRHSNYKRCIDNAEACKHKRWRNDEGFDYARSHRQMLKWLELAEKFKEGV